MEPYVPFGRTRALPMRGRGRGRGDELQQSTSGRPQVETIWNIPLNTPQPAPKAYGIGHRPSGPATGQRSSDDSRETNVRGSLRGRREEKILVTKPSNIPSKHGTSGTIVSLLSNYFELKRLPAWNIYQYRVDFKPDVHLVGLRKFLVRSLLAGAGYLFDGTVLFTVNKINVQDVVERTARGKLGEEFLVIFTYAKDVSTMDSTSLQVFNLILRHAMNALKLQLVGRNFFDPAARKQIPQFKFELWPGYTTSIRQHEHHIMMCAEITHKVMRTETIHDIMVRISREDRDFQGAFLQEVLGTTVLTDYNNKTYRIDDVDFSKKPSDTFDTKNGPVSFIDYYHDKYQKVIKDPNQPMIVSKAKARDLRGGQDNTILLVPELCRATGITEKMRSNRHAMRAMSEYTRVGPQSRINQLINFNRRLQNTGQSMQILNGWQLELNSQLVEVPGRQLAFEKIFFGNGVEVKTTSKVDWNAGFRGNAMYDCGTGLKRWYIIVPTQTSKDANNFLGLMHQAASGMNFPLAKPRILDIPDDRQSTYVDALETCAVQNPEMIMCVVTNNSADRYSNIKKKCCLDRAIPTQVIRHETITPKSGKPLSSLLSVATKVVIQMNCKMGGAPWMIDLPTIGLMTVGFDVCHDTKDKSKSFGALVATMDLTKKVEFFSTVSAHKNGEELSNDLALNMRKALQEYRSINGSLPNRIAFYRDGVGEGQVEHVLEHEVNRLKLDFAELYKEAGIEKTPKFIFIIVSKHINTRLFMNGQNPTPGIVVDDVITLPERYDFFLISQSVRDGSVSPTSYNVIYDTSGLSTNNVQKLTHKMTHLYYNWNGTVSVPAVCQYAHKLAFLVSQSIHSSPNRRLEKKLYFL